MAELYDLLVKGSLRMVSSSLTSLFMLVDLMIAGRFFGSTTLSAAAIANALFSLISVAIFAPIETMLDSTDLVSKEFNVVRAHQTSFYAILWCIPFALTLFLYSPVYMLVPDVYLAQTSVSFFNTLLIGMLPLSIFTSYVACFESTNGSRWSIVYIDAFANFLNIVLTAILIQYESYLGSPIATSICRLIQLGLVVYVIRREAGAQVLKSCCTNMCSFFDSKNRPGKKFMRTIKLFIVQCLEYKIIELFTFMAAWLTLTKSTTDSASLNAFVVITSFCEFMYTGLPTGLSIAGKEKVEQILELNSDIKAAKSTMLTTFTGCTLYMFFTSIVFVFGYESIGVLFLPSPEFLLQIKHVLTPSLFYMLLKGSSTSLSTLLSIDSFGLSKLVQVVRIISFWGIGLPCSYAMLVYGKMGLAGILWGIVISHLLLTIFNLVVFRRINFILLEST
jgi:Na+-driven multidrug efflux pump